MANKYKKIDNETLEIEKTVKVEVSKNNLEEEKENLEKQLSVVNEKLNALE